MSEKKRRSRPIVRLAVTMGCPCSIGPEIAVKAALAISKADPLVYPLLVGSVAAARAGARAMNLDAARVVRVQAPGEAWHRAARGAAFVYEPTEPLAAADRRPGKPTAAAGAAQLAWIDAATDLVTSDQADVLVTGPVSKDAIARSGARGAATFRGHTEHLADRLGAGDVTMCFYSTGLVSSLVTTHLPIAKVPRAITKEAVARAIVHTAWLMRLASDDAKRRPIVVTSLNPHAGENGLLGDEERTEIAPGIELAKKKMKELALPGRVEGPMGAESAFRHAAAGAFSAVVAMFHDQATIAMKMHGWSEAVNVTLGLPIVRTSVDHGTAYDQAGKGTADHAAMLQAMKVGAMIQRRWHPRRT